MHCAAGATGEALSLMLRPGNAAADSISGHTEVLDAAVEAMGGDFAAGHREGDDPSLVKAQLRVRVDSAGCTEFLHECRARDIGFSVTARRNTDVRAAVLKAADMTELWEPALKAQHDIGSGETGSGDTGSETGTGDRQRRPAPAARPAARPASLGNVSLRWPI